MKDFFFGVIVLCLIVNVLIPSRITRSSQRRIYWGSTCTAAISGFLAFYPDWKTGLAIAGLWLAAMTFAAYAATPYIKIGGKIYAVTVSLRQPEPEDRARREEGRCAIRSGPGLLQRDAHPCHDVVDARRAGGDRDRQRLPLRGGSRRLVRPRYGGGASSSCWRSASAMATRVGATALPAASTFPSASRRLSLRVASPSCT